MVDRLVQHEGYSQLITDDPLGAAHRGVLDAIQQIFTELEAWQAEMRQLKEARADEQNSPL